MVKTLVALYGDPITGQRVVEALLETGFSGDDISLLVKDTKAATNPSAELSAGEGVGLGALVGALVGIGSVFVPGIGPLMGTGALAVAVTAGIGAAAGALTGGISAGLLALDLNEEEARYYENGLHSGGTVVSVTSNEAWLEWAQKIMARYQPLKLEEREAKWYATGWDSSSRMKLPTQDRTSDDAQPEMNRSFDRPPSDTVIKRVQRVKIYDN